MLIPTIPIQAPVMLPFVAAPLPQLVLGWRSTLDKKWEMIEMMTLFVVFVQEGLRMVHRQERGLSTTGASHTEMVGLYRSTR